MSKPNKKVTFKVESDDEYKVQDITKLEKLLWYNNHRRYLEKSYRLNFDHFPSITSNTHEDEIDQVYKYMRHIYISPDITNYISLIKGLLINKYNTVDEIFHDPKSGIRMKLNNAQSYIIACERQFLDSDRLFVTQNFSTDFIEVVDEMIKESLLDLPLQSPKQNTSSNNIIL